MHNATVRLVVNNMETVTNEQLLSTVSYPGVTVRVSFCLLLVVCGI